VWNAASGQLLAALQGHTSFVCSAVFSPDGQRIVTSSYDRTARVFRVVTLSEIAELLSQ
jgi:WD40 repeat protein